MYLCLYLCLYLCFTCACTCTWACFWPFCLQSTSVNFNIYRMQSVYNLQLKSSINLQSTANPLKINNFNSFLSTIYNIFRPKNPSTIYKFFALLIYNPVFFCFFRGSVRLLLPGPTLVLRVLKKVIITRFWFHPFPHILSVPVPPFY